MTDAELAQLCADSYNPLAVWEHTWTADDIHVAHKLVEGVDVIVFRGSVDVNDWMADFDAIPTKHPLLGWCHAGFLRYMDLVFENVLGVLGREIIVTGHSLGAARASILTGLLLSHGSQVKARVVFGEPRPGFRQLKTIIEQSGCESRCYRNGEDPVTEVPLYFEPLLRYVHPSEPILLNAAPDPGDLSPLQYHHINLYVKGLTK
jgi:Lipase (class 3)